MNLLLQSKQTAEQHFGKHAVMAPNLLGMVGQGEKSFSFLTGDMSQGFEVTFGFFNDKARYIAFQKRTGSPWGEGDLRSALMQIGDYSDWSITNKSDFFDYVEKSGKKIVAEATGWQSPRRRYAFVYIPQVAGEVGIMPDKTAIDHKFAFS
ncbi:MAG TPA: hypothetical protein VJ719_08930 [Chthoniobacterales bacterium]|nr:hypothetical protein [Chthoniobacterales bacterium]